ncbi:transmembrane protein, putative (macronuclear) [Tetrahymena thermophila SB210]|uniref:Transmembrane protein, putative n=1 Tax=Tetrahymena thermophila (strain SB210) TaxID=312017 RepID=W7XFQ6_TETTS|nr:transmembrane protein, putative [Tetrahymena thermophila SB210]EWS72841.1 transmembrane protein, putative [Tetrahymena thermophila SB210]|eukprot:XP_012654632.1 transmembrane protein, putative [Tetrahymena thermophila SB210]
MLMIQISLVLNLPDIQNLQTILQILLPLFFSILTTCEIQTTDLYNLYIEPGVFQDYLFRDKMANYYFQNWFRLLFIIICCIKISEIQNIFIYYLVFSMLQVIIAQIKYLNKIENYSRIIREYYICITLIVISHISIDQREISDELYKQKEQTQINYSNLIIVVHLIQKIYIYFNLLALQPYKNIFGFSNYLWIYLLLIVIDLIF